MASPTSSVLFIFIDGLGIGPQDPASNPLATFDGRVLRFFLNQAVSLPRSGLCLATDSRLGVKGLPQSATGQTTLFTGRNAARQIGRHLQGFPNEPLRLLLAEYSIFRRLKSRGLRVSFANTYTPRFFQKRPRWLSATTVMCETAGVDFFRLEDLLEQRSLFADFTNRLLQRQDLDVPLRTPAEAARILVEMSRSFDFCLYEYFLTDWVGHRGSFEQAVSLLRELDEFLAAVLETMDLDRASLVVSSDHGNIEDMARKQHTLNPVPTLLWGPIQRQFGRFTEAFSLEGVTPTLEHFLAGEGGRNSDSNTG